MPMKCMAQIPPPMLAEPAASHTARANGAAVDSRCAIIRAAREAKAATRKDSPTNQGV
ncbi:hypothetical protein [Azospirillum sp. INR13]|uniref:hypothetical protein n=1 Tax=Azospirillum sp. INR13 TaxID=2596919 RepID=UPI002105C1A8|nr:hypothetical protein [Azospirillum sp. INR13]